MADEATSTTARGADRLRQFPLGRVVAVAATTAAVAAIILLPTHAATNEPGAAPVTSAATLSSLSTQGAAPVETSTSSGTSSATASATARTIQHAPASAAEDSDCTSYAAANQVPTSDVDRAFVHRCVVRPVGVEDIAQFSPPTSEAPDGSLARAVALLETAGSDFYQEYGGVEEVRAGFSTVRVPTPLPGGAVAYDAVSAWVLAWKPTPRPVPCPYPGDEALASFAALPPLGSQSDWRFIIVPTGEEAPLIVEPRRDFCSQRYEPRVLPVFRHVHPDVSATGDYEAYPCAGYDNYSGDAATGAVDLVIGVPVDATLCAPSTRHLEGFKRGVTTLAAPGPVRGWPNGLAKP